jgi:ankyrin repeat protein
LGLEKAVKQILHAHLSNPDIVIDLVQWSKHPDGTEFYLTPLTIAAAQNRPDIVETLLEFGATLGVVSLDKWKDYKGTTALHVASEKGFEVIVDMLLRADAKPHSQRSMGDAQNTQTGRHEQPTESTLCIGPQKSHDELQRLLEQTPRPTVDLPDLIGWSSLCIASCRGFDKTVDVLLRHGANMNFQSESKSIRWRSVSPLYVASENGHLAIVETLLNHGTKVQGYSSSPLYAACANGHINIAKILIQKGASVDAINESSPSPLYAACSNGRIDIAEILLQKGASVDAIHKSSFSPLYAACANGHIEIAKMLLQKGANTDAPYDSNHSFLHGAASNGHTDIFKLLLQYGSEVHQLHHNDRIFSYLHGASAKGNVEIVKMLLEHGAKTHLMKEALSSPIHATINCGHLEVFDLLISYGANINQWQDAKTPLQLAMDLKQLREDDPLLETIIERLRELGGKTTRELRLQETRELMRKSREENARSAEQQELVDLPKEHP